MADELILRVPLKLAGSSTRNGNARESGDEVQMDVQIESGDLSEIMKELSATCYEYDREPVRRMICRVSQLLYG
jgi:nuclear pore complex protein Nup85